MRLPALALLTAPLLLAAPGPTPEPLTCDIWNPLHGDPSLFCMELVARPEWREASGVVRLIPAPSPFGIAVDADGRAQYQLEIHLQGLPTPAAGARHVAWVTGPMLDSPARLGAVSNGVTRAGTTSLEKFLLFVTEQRDSTLALDRIVLRGMSPSSALLPHAVVAMRSEHRHSTSGWEMPPVHPLAPVTMAGMAELEPTAEPWLPSDPGSNALPGLRARQLVRLADGDTLALEAGMVERSVAGRTFVAYAFNGQSPGPLIQVARGARVVVRVTNHLDLPTTVHWHGIRLDSRFDGAAGVTQEPIQPGDEFTYQLVFPDAGIFWYHPHVREDIQQELGLYGNILVRGGDSSAMGRVHREEVLVLDDILLGENGPIPFGGTHATHSLMGRFGNVLMVNGEPAWSAAARPGEVIRFYLTNASNVRTFNLSLAGARMKLVAGDMGRVAEEQWVGSVVIGPAERWVVDAEMPASGLVFLVNRVRGIEPAARAFLPVVDTMGVIAVGGAPAAPPLGKGFARLRSHRDLRREFASATRAAERPPDHTLVLSLRTDSIPFALVRAFRLDTAWTQPVEWAGLMPMMDWIPTSREAHWVLRDSTTGRENMAINWSVRVGDRMLLRIVNDRHVLHPMNHPIHLHGQRFVVVARNGEPVTDHVWKDTVIIPAGATADLWVEFDNPGQWMLHCHTAEHLEAGMHAVVTVTSEQ